MQILNNNYTWYTNYIPNKYSNQIKIIESGMKISGQKQTLLGEKQTAQLCFFGYRWVSHNWRGA